MTRIGIIGGGAAGIAAAITAARNDREAYVFWQRETGAAT